MDPDFAATIVVICVGAGLALLTAVAQLIHEKAKYIRDQNQREAEKHCANMACGTK